MALRKAIGVVKDQTSISLAKVTGNVAPDLEVLIVKATNHDNEPADEKYVREILHLMSYSKSYINACVYGISKRLSKTHDWIVALKALMLVHRLLSDGDSSFGQEIMYANRKGTRVLNMTDFRDEAHSNSWDHSGFVRTFGLYLDQKLEFMMYEKKISKDEPKRDSYGDLNDSTPVYEMKPEKVLERLNHLVRVLDRFLACKPTGAAKNSRMILVALYSMVKESFKLYDNITEALVILLDRFHEMEYSDCAKTFDEYVNAAKKIDQLIGFFNWCKDIGVARSSEFPDIQRINDKLLETLEGFLREKGNKTKSEVQVKVNKEEEVMNINEIKALPAPVIHKPDPQVKPFIQEVKVKEDLVNLKDEGVNQDTALSLFAGPTNGTWEVFSSEVTSAWQNPAAEIGKPDWELALVETNSNLSKQKADLGGGFEPLILNGMYDQGTVRQHVSNSQMNNGSSSSVVLPSGPHGGKVLALPAPDGTVQVVGPQDPFAASLSVPPPAYVQIAEMDRKQELLLQEQNLWQQYANNGMQGQLGLTKISGPYGMPQTGGAGYYYSPF